MHRSLLVGAGLLGVVGVAWAEPPVVGKERTHLEQELYLPDRSPPKAVPTDAPGRPSTPAPSGSSSWRAWVVRTAIGPLNVSPFAPADVW